MPLRRCQSTMSTPPPILPTSPPPSHPPPLYCLHLPPSFLLLFTLSSVFFLCGNKKNPTPLLNPTLLQPPRAAPPPLPPLVPPSRLSGSFFLAFFRLSRAVCGGSMERRLLAPRRIPHNKLGSCGYGGERERDKRRPKIAWRRSWRLNNGPSTELMVAVGGPRLMKKNADGFLFFF